MRTDIGSRTDVGRVRNSNEDNYRVVPALNLFVLSDGMGGEAHGEIASAMAVESVAAHCLAASNNLATPFFGETRSDLSEKTNRLSSAVYLANRKIHEAATVNAAQRGMGTTILAAWLDGQRLSLVHVGDSRAYLLRGGALEQLTSDHSLVAEQVRRGLLTPQQADASEMQSVLIRALGTQPSVDIDTDEQLLIDGDALLLCSDGLTCMVTDPEIASTLLNYPGAQSATDRLVELANDYGGQDNITVVVVRIEFGSNGLISRLRRIFGDKKNSGAPTSPFSGGGH